MREMDGNNFGYLIPHFNWVPASLEYPQAQSLLQVAEPLADEEEGQRRRLEKKIKDLQLRLAQLQQQNSSLKRQLKPKRRYSKRRVYLRKDHQCPPRGVQETVFFQYCPEIPPAEETQRGTLIPILSILVQPAQSHGPRAKLAIKAQYFNQNTNSGSFLFAPEAPSLPIPKQLTIVGFTVLALAIQLKFGCFFIKPSGGQFNVQPFINLNCYNSSKFKQIQPRQIIQFNPAPQLDPTLSTFIVPVAASFIIGQCDQIQMNFLNGQGQGMVQQPASIGAMQAYITELTLYINENNEKYTRNLETLKQFYEEQINNLSQSVGQQEDHILQLRNENLTLKDLLLNRNTEIAQLKSKIEQLKADAEDLADKNRQERGKNQQVYQHMDKLRESMQASIDKEIDRSRALEEERSQLLLQTKEKEAQIRMLQSQISSLEEKVAERFSLPERMKDMEIQSAKDKTNIINLESRLAQAIKERDFSQTELQRRRKENQKLSIQANKSKGDLSFEIEQAVRRQKEALAAQIETLKLEDERKVYEIKDLEMKLKQKAQVCLRLENALAAGTETSRRYEAQIKELREDKSVYLNEFRRLKGEYEEVINNLEAAIPEYQKKNWALEQENQDLNTQLDSLQELLREVRAMNDMEPVRKEYRQWAELNLAADKKLPEQNVVRKQESNERVGQNSMEANGDWERLMSEIDRIQV